MAYFQDGNNVFVVIVVVVVVLFVCVCFCFSVFRVSTPSNSRTSQS